MITTFQPTSPERAADPSTALDRNGTPNASSGPRFSDLLQRGQAAHGVLASKAPQAPRTATEGSQRRLADPAAEAPRSPAQPPPSRAVPAKAAARPAAPPHEKAATTTAPAAPASAPGSPDTPDRATATETGTALPANEGVSATAAQPATLGDWLAGLKGLDATALPADDTAAAMAGADGPAARAGSGQGADSRLAPRADKSRLRDVAGASPGTAVGAAAASATAADVRPARIEATISHDPLPAPIAGAIGIFPRGLDPLAPASVALATPVYSPAFAQALGAQVSLLARDGVQQAELHLNPAEMGPISVQIEIVGQTARIDFGADMPATREVIERGLPELASALREQGLTLSGGGVFQHGSDSRRPASGDTGAGRATRRGATGDDATVRTLLARAPQGMLDLYA